MPCMISLKLRNSAKEMESPSHPLDEAWLTSLKLLRGQLVGFESRIQDRCYCCVDQEDPRQAFFLYSETICFIHKVALMFKIDTRVMLGRMTQGYQGDLYI